jgi:hypothetical protein
LRFFFARLDWLTGLCDPERNFRRCLGLAMGIVRGWIREWDLEVKLELL